MTWQIETQIPCTAAAAQEVASQIVQRLEELHVASRSIFAVRLSFEELLVTAFTARSDENSQAPIPIRGTIDAAEIRLTVDDSTERLFLEFDSESRS